MALRTLLLYAVSPETQTLSYQVGWPVHVQRDPRFRCTAINLAAGRAARMWGAVRSVGRRWDAVVLLHSVFSNACFLAGPLRDLVARIDAAKAYFVGNEYKLMPEKMAMCRQVGVRLLVSMTSNPAVHRLYEEALGCKVVNIPSAGLDPGVFHPTRTRAERPIDLGYRGADDPLYFGHQDRRSILGAFQATAVRHGLRIDASFDRARLPRAAYAEFLNCCKGQLGAEAGTDYFDLDDATRLRVNAYLRGHPNATLEELQRTCLPPREQARPARMISGRHVEAAGTKTVQILFEGHYNGYFAPDVHYIPLKKDFSNIDDVLEKFREAEYCRRVVENAYEVAVSELTYPKLIDKFHTALVSAI